MTAAITSLLAITLLTATSVVLSRPTFNSADIRVNAPARGGVKSLQSSNVTWSIDASTSTISISPDLYGIFFEEINHAGVGGLYAEQINNANFETALADYAPWMIQPLPQNTRALVSLTQDYPVNAYNPTALKIVSDVSSGSGGIIAISNPGFWGISTRNVYSFDVALWAQSSTVSRVTVSLQSADGQLTYAATSIDGVSSSWQKFTTALSGFRVNDSSAIFTVSWNTTSARDEIIFDVFSVMPTVGWRGLKYIRTDLADMVAAMKPSFVRFPGGCYVEGDRLNDRFNWIRAIGPQENRRGHWNLWGYYSEDGLGMFEYLSFVEKLTDAYGQPTRVVWVVNNGIAHSDSIPTIDIDAWVQEALDSIEFAQGPTTSKYGAIRAAMGHPAPFKIAHLAIGNEDCGKPFYDTNYNAFYNAITKAYPDIVTIANCQNPGKGLPVQSYDYHVYQTAQWFFDNQRTFDSFKRDGTFIFNSEYAVTTGSGTRGNWLAGLGEAAWMTGLERNSDLVTLASYAPLFVNDHNRQWSPDAICFVSDQAFGTPSYWVQVLYGNSFSDITAGTNRALHYTVDDSSCSKCPLSVAVTVGAVKRVDANTVFVHKIVNYGADPLTISVNINGLPNNATVNPVFDVQYLTGNPADENDFENPRRVAPQNTTLRISSSSFAYTFLPYSLYVIRAYATI